MTNWSKYEVKDKVNNPTDWSQYEVKNEPESEYESTGLIGVGNDLMDLFSNAITNATNLPDTLEKSGEYIEQNPAESIGHNLGQLTAGAADTIKGIINSPADLPTYLAKKELLPGQNLSNKNNKSNPINSESDLKKSLYKNFSSSFHGNLANQLIDTVTKILPRIPEDTGIEKALGLKPDKEKGDDLIRAVPDIAALAFGGAGVLKQGKKLFKAPDLKESIRQTQSKVNQAMSEAGKIFDKVENEVEAKGLSKVPVDKDVIKQAESFLANTPANKELIKKAKTGDYKALRSLQADLRVKGEKALSSAFTAENKMGEEILSTRDEVNKSIQNHLEKTGYEDLANALNEARGKYKDIQKTYFSTPSLAKVFGKSQKVPKNPKTLLTEESAEMKKFMKAHPEVEKDLAKALKHEKKMNRLKLVGSVLGIGTTAEVAREILGGK